ncbi:MAG TPA: NAD(P)/FAD-dependent oxidoreductase [Solirubrobacteraceae bacterium]|jgi:cation diffusion facilitator CzcD-associated flavoprotein CzcO|nr:NAD(P)/FAD-dependent oxidoreductase [Solirubrobacteraceae bacterium]
MTAGVATAGAVEPDHEVVIVGAGFGGIGAAVKLQQAGLHDFVILEQADEVGGTWRDNSYPGLAVDIPSFSYQFSFELNPDWSRVFARGAEVQEYAVGCVEKHHLREHLWLNTRVDSASFDDEHHLWRLDTGANGPLTARFLITATGGFGQPKRPEIEGLDSFTGKTMHTAHWDHAHNLDGERVAVIGTGATSVQLLPRIAPKVERLYVFQRTPIWVLPKPDFEFPGAAKFIFRHAPLVQDSVRLGASAAVEAAMVLGVMNNRQLPWLVKGIERLGRRFIRSQVKDPVLQQKLTPQYGFGCKRPSMSNEYFVTFNRANTHLITDPIECITDTGIRTADGVTRELDTLVLATGYQTTEPENAPPVPIIGRNDADLGAFWREQRFQAYEGVSIPGFPNLFLTFGPYAFTGSSWMFMVENQSAHAIRVIAEARKRGATCAEIRRVPHQRHFEHTLRRQQNTIFFNNGCGTANSYYFDAHGDAPFLRPSTALEAWWRAHHFDLDNYRFERTQESPAPSVQTTRRRRIDHLELVASGEAGELVGTARPDQIEGSPTP